MSTEQMSINPSEFLFKRPEYIDELGLGSNIAIAKGSLASRLVQELRTRTIHPDGRRENVAEHGYMVAKISVAIVDEFYPWMDRGKVAIHAINHDDPEAWVGDTPTDVLAGHDPKAKVILEQAGVDKLVEEYAPITPKYVDDMVTYEKQEEHEAQLVRIVDKMTVLLIHIPDNGKTLRENYTYDQYVAATYETEKRLLEQYPHFIELIEMRTELGLYICEKYLRGYSQAD